VVVDRGSRVHDFLDREEDWDEEKADEEVDLLIAAVGGARPTRTAKSLRPVDPGIPVDLGIHWSRSRDLIS
jgi:hypothetical protein